MTNSGRDLISSVTRDTSYPIRTATTAVFSVGRGCWAAAGQRHHHPAPTPPILHQESGIRISIGTPRNSGSRACPASGTPLKYRAPGPALQAIAQSVRSPSRRSVRCASDRDDEALTLCGLDAVHSRLDSADNGPALRWSKTLKPRCDAMVGGGWRVAVASIRTTTPGYHQSPLQ